MEPVSRIGAVILFALVGFAIVVVGAHHARPDARHAAPVAKPHTAAKTQALAKTNAALKAKAVAPTVAQRRRQALARDIADHKVVVLLFWNRRAADDQATRDAVLGVDRHGGRVAVHVVPVDRVADYGALLSGVTVAQSPTTLIIGRGGATRSIAGLTEPHELAQAVGDALAGR